MPILIWVWSSIPVAPFGWPPRERDWRYSAVGRYGAAPMGRQIALEVVDPDDYDEYGDEEYDEEESPQQPPHGSFQQAALNALG